MTIIVGIHTQGQTYIGSDSRACSGETIMPTIAEKWIFVQPGEAIGLSGDGRQFDLLKEKLTIPGGHVVPPLTAYAIANKIIEAFRDAGFRDDASKGVGAQAYGFGCIFATPDAVYDIDACGAVSLIDDGVLWARGSGRDFALGAGHALQQLNIRHPQQVAHEAIKAAIAFDNGCGGDIVLRHLTVNGV